MNTPSKNQTSMQKMVNGVKLAFFLSLATNILEVYRFMNEPGGLRNGISIALAIMGTLLIWQFSRALQAEKKQALYYWLALLLAGYTRWIFVDGAFSLNVLSIMLIGVAAVFTLRIVNWVRNKSLT